jgi:protein SCO1/2
MVIKSRLLQIVILAGLALTLAGAYLVWRAARGPQPALPAGAVKTLAATVVSDERPLPAVRLASPHGEVTERSLLGHWTFVFFGYTQCPDICPSSLSLLAQVEKKLAARGKPRAEVLFVSVDPRRDTPELLANFVPAFDPAFVGAAGSDADLAPLAKHLGVFYQRHDEQDKRHYPVDHTAAIYLIDPLGRLKAVFSEAQDADRMASDFLTLSRQ